MGGTPWLTTEITTLQKLYPKGGVACVQIILDKTSKSIRQQAAKLKIKFIGGKHIKNRGKDIAILLKEYCKENYHEQS